MYQDYFGLKELPFSIAPDPRYLYMSERHREALAHLLYGVSGQGGFVVLTGEVGTGKTTICRCFLQRVPPSTDVAFIVNPKLSARELLASICDEFNIEHKSFASVKILNDTINQYLLSSHAEGRHTVLIIDEAQNLRVDVLEQLRLLTNLETSEKKLLQIVLLGQPELREMLAQPELRQLSQRVTARYHLAELNPVEVGAYLQCRLSVAGRKNKLFDPSAIKQLHKSSQGVPRLINLFADRALLGAYANQDDVVSKPHVKQAVKEILDLEIASKKPILNVLWAGAITSIVIMSALIYFALRTPTNTLEASADLSRNNVEEVEAALSPKATEQPKATDESENFTSITDLEPVLQSESGTQVDPLNNVAFVTNVASSETTISEIPNPTASPPASFDKPFISELNQLTTDTADVRGAYTSVLARWGYDFSQAEDESACRFAELRGLGCMHRRGSWNSLLQIDRPAILSLQRQDGSTIHIAMLKIDDDYALFSYGDEQYWTDTSTIQSAWFGKFTVIWYKPPYMDGLIKPNESSDQNTWLTQKFDAVYQLKNPDSKSVTQNLEDRVLTFQREQGLVADGVVGELTLIKLNDLVGSEAVPRLMHHDGAS